MGVNMCCLVSHVHQPAALHELGSLRSSSTPGLYPALACVPVRLLLCRIPGTSSAGNEPGNIHMSIQASATPCVKDEAAFKSSSSTAGMQAAPSAAAQQPCTVKREYVPSQLEQSWLDNVGTWQMQFCNSLQPLENATKVWLSTLAAHDKMQAQMLAGPKSPAQVRAQLCGHGMWGQSVSYTSPAGSKLHKAAWGVQWGVQHSCPV